MTADLQAASTVAEVMALRGSLEDWALDARISDLLLELEQRWGLTAFTPQQRMAAAVQGMQREVNNGGWLQFFFNDSGFLAADLVPALDEIGASEHAAVARQALLVFGTLPSLDEGPRHAHLSSLTSSFRTQPWAEYDRAYVALESPIEDLLLSYVQRNLAAFA